jgi:organic radical activating enzyme
MLVKDIVDEAFQDYKKPAMFIATAKCDWKCCTEAGCDKSLCQNSPIAKQKSFQIPNDEIVKRYMANPLTKAIVIGGLEPFLQEEELLSLIHTFREQTQDDIVIYTGYRLEEVAQIVERLSHYNSIIVKFGRFLPKSTKVYDKTLGIWLNSNNQYAERIS